MNPQIPSGSPQPNPVPPGYQPFGGGPAMLAPKRSGMAVASVVLGSLSIPLIFLCIGWITAILAIVLGFVAIGTISKSQGRIVGRGNAVGGIVTAFVAMLIYSVFLFFMAKAKADRPESEKAAERAVEEVESLLSRSGDGARGETEAEREVAAAFVKTFETLHGAFIVRENAVGDDTSVRGDFTAVCDFHENGCTILARVPEYKKHTDDAKNTVAEMAWLAANQALAEHSDEVPEGTPLLVGLKGIALYGSVMTGRVGAEEPDDTTDDKDAIEEFYLIEEATE